MSNLIIPIKADHKTFVDDVKQSTIFLLYFILSTGR